MSQPNPPRPPPPSTPPSNWPQQSGGNPFADQGQSPFVPGGPPPGYYGQPLRPIEDEPGIRWILPVGQSGWAIAAGYLGLFSAICFPAPLAIVCGIVAIWHLRKNPRLSGWGRAIFGLVMGTLGTLGLVIALVALALGQ